MNKWDGIKSTGIDKMTNLKARELLQGLTSDLNNQSIFLVPVGELENFVPSISGHGNAWVDKVLNKHPSFSDPIYSELLAFIRDIDL